LKYKVTIEETHSKVKEVEANTPEGALSIVKDLYDDGEVRLDDTDFKEVVFGVDAPGPTERFPLETGRYIKDVILDTLEDAEKTIKFMHEIMAHYECVLVSDVYDLIGKDSTYEDSKYGWVDISDATIIRCEEGWKISLHQAFPIDAFKNNKKETD
jgi:hypothetical protein